MDPLTKLLLDELRLLSDRFAKVEDRVDALDHNIGKRFTALEQDTADIGSCFRSLEAETLELRDW